ncbi:polysaccharide deacetylase family protein [Brachybacterium nesterenkovii]|uniref:polysaccharide deacetylase family protein n=1 Tax=Brachybacterium nesterenkovii TaxID=47847 RepID=UPI000B359983|nr:polysaccharide deacetylase family protein [Brachybacterium nesterenkovii]
MRSDGGRGAASRGRGPARRGVLTGAGLLGTLGLVAIGGRSLVSALGAEDAAERRANGARSEAGADGASPHADSLLAALPDLASRVPEATTTDLALLDRGPAASVPRLPSARGLSSALDVTLNKVLREHGYAGDGAGTLALHGQVAVCGRDVLGAVLSHRDARGETALAVYYRAEQDRALTSPGLIAPEQWMTFEKAVAALARDVPALDSLSLADALQEQPRPWGNGPTILPGDQGALRLLFPAALRDGEHTAVELVLPARETQPLLSDDGRAVLAAVAAPADFDPATVTPPGDAASAPAAAPDPSAPKPSAPRAADAPGPISQLAPRSGPGVRPSPVPAPDASRLRALALTFDDGPSPQLNGKLRDALDARRAPATFFMIGRSVAASPAWCTRTALAGMEVGSHSWSHAQLDKKRGAGLDEQLTRASEEIARCTGRPPFLLRAPYGARNRRSDDAAGRLGEADVLWDVDTEDWKTLDTDANIAAVHRDAHRGAIILMHEIHPTSVAAVPAILQDLQAQGYCLLTCSELAQGTVAAGSHWRHG